MVKRRLVPMAVLVASTVIVAACDVTEGPLASGARPEPPRTARTLDDEPGLDGEFVRLARRIPGFGGYWFDEHGDLVVSLTDLRRGDAARAAVADVAARRPQRREHPYPGAAAIRLRKVAYDFVQLAEWRRRVMEQGAPGVVFLDVDEAANRLRIGAEKSALAEVRAGVAALGIPAAAVIVEPARPLRLAASLSAYTRPVKGGLRIVRPDGGMCTLGLNVYFSNPHYLTSGPAFLTASHCTTTWLAADSPVVTTFSQGGARIGQEVADPPYRTYEDHALCPNATTIASVPYPPARCRYSDVAVIRYDAGVSWSLGAIARTGWAAVSGITPGDTMIDAANPEFHVNGAIPWPAQGEFVYKMGATTGWTGGEIKQSCVTYTGLNHPPDRTQRWVFFCQNQVLGWARDGDSGAPVFGWNGGSNVSAYGIVFGLDPEDSAASVHFWFSSIGDIQQDFGVGFTWF